MSKPAFKPPPHLNAESHARVMEAFRAMNREQVRELLVKAGTHEANGELAEHYRETPLPHR